MPADLKEKTERYYNLLHRALNRARPVAREDSYLMEIAADFRRMAESYLRDGEHFKREGDLVNALVCFSYGHAWLDAGARLGVFDVDDDDLFAI